MKINKLLTISVISFLATTTSFAAPMFQAGSIEEGKTVTISEDSGVASYFEKGTTGLVRFSCRLEGDVTDSCGAETGLQASLMPGKNFSNGFNSPFTPLNKGDNGPFTWRLTNTGEDVGNIKVFYKCGKNVTVTCAGHWSPE